MTTTVIRWNIPVDGQVHEVPGFPGSVLHVDCRERDSVDVWVRHEEPEDPDLRPRRYVVVGTGQPWPVGTSHVGTALSPQRAWGPNAYNDRGVTAPGELVWHLLEVH